MRTFFLTTALLLCGYGWCLAQTNTPTGSPLTLYPACPCYHELGLGNGDTRIDARLNLNPAHQTGSVLTVQLLDAQGRVLQTASTNASSGGTVGVNLHVPVQAIATFRIAARLLDGAGNEIAKAGTDVKICPAVEARVQMGPDGFLRIGDRPQFPIGLYSTAKYKEVAKAGFTVTQNYQITTGEAEEAINPTDMHLKQLLDQSWANGMRMMVELPRKAIEQGQWAQVQRRIETFRHHPGLLCWDSEERVARGKTTLENLATLYSLVHKLDPNHPFILGDCRDLTAKAEKDQRNFFPEASMDVGVWWWYPIPLKSTVPILAPPAWLTNTSTKKPLWIAIQSYEQPWAHSRYPTPAEYRAMAYLSIIKGVKALFFYTGSGERDVHGKPAGVLDQRELSHWDYVQSLVRELRQVTPIIVAPASTPQFALSPPNAPVEFSARELGGKLYLLAANKSVQPQSVQFSSPALKGRQVKVLYEIHAAAIAGDMLKDEFAPLGVHVYQIE